MQIKLNGSILLSKDGKVMSFAKLTQEQLEAMFPNQDVEIIHEGGSSKVSVEKCQRLGITDKDQQDRFFAIAKKYKDCNSELEQLLKDNHCYYKVDDIPTEVLVGFDWYIQNVDSPDAKLVERTRKARATKQ